ncbi:MAG: ABC transporter permease, partial [Verrucomicrobiae bacterium]|nr:ABC transporter permease [Verrucomicrobiae bacterium]
PGHPPGRAGGRASQREGAPMYAGSTKPAATGLKGFLRSHEAILLLGVLLELILFSAAGRNFLTPDNLTNLVRHSAEIGLIALVMLPVILTAGIDLSVGSLLGLCAIVFGKLWRDAGWPWPVAAAATLAAGASGGGINALLVTRFRLPPLIVTLGTFSLFRGLAEALTRGTDAFTNFPESFLGLGQGNLAGLPVQAWILGWVAAVAGLLVHRGTWGRSWRAIGFAPEGARYAGLPVAGRTAAAYVAAGLVVAVAALTYTARLGTAKADAGLGYELAAITAVVLGGASIFGGVGSVHGTLLGVAAMAILTNGLSRVPATMSLARELSGLFTGVILILALAASTLSQGKSFTTGSPAPARPRDSRPPPADS